MKYKELTYAREHDNVKQIYNIPKTQIHKLHENQEPTLKQYYKLAKLNGWDWYTGNTINYRENIGKTVKVPNQAGKPTLCSNTVIHASRRPNDCFIGAKLPSSCFLVRGNPVIETPDKCGFKKLKIIKEIPQENLDELFGWKYQEVCNPIYPFKITPPKITEEHEKLVVLWDSVWSSVWDSVWSSVGDSVRDSVRASVRASVGDSVWDPVWSSVRDSVWSSVGDSVRESVWDSVWDPVWSSVRDSVWSYIGSLFPKIKKWKYIKHKRGVYPYQACVDLWKQGLVSSYDNEVWRLHGNEDAEILWTQEVK